MGTSASCWEGRPRELCVGGEGGSKGRVSEGATRPCAQAHFARPRLVSSGRPAGCLVVDLAHDPPPQAHSVSLGSWLPFCSRSVRADPFNQRRLQVLTRRRRSPAMDTQLDVPPPPPPYSAVAPPSPPRLDCLPYDVLVRILRLATVSYAFLEERLAAVWWLVRDGRLVSRTLRDGAPRPSPASAAYDDLGADGSPRLFPLLLPVIQLHLRTTLYPVYLANIRPPFLSSFSPPLPRQPLSTPGAAHDVVTFFSTHAHLHELRALNRFIVAHTHGQSVRGESELMLDGGDEWKLEVFTMLQVRGLPALARRSRSTMLARGADAPTPRPAAARNAPAGPAAGASVPARARRLPSGPHRPVVQPAAAHAVAPPSVARRPAHRDRLARPHKGRGRRLARAAAARSSG